MAVPEAQRWPRRRSPGDRRPPRDRARGVIAGTVGHSRWRGPPSSWPRSGPSPRSALCRPISWSARWAWARPARCPDGAGRPWAGAGPHRTRSPTCWRRDISTTTWIQVVALLGATVGAAAVARTEEAWGAGMPSPRLCWPSRLPACSPRCPTPRRPPSLLGAASRAAGPAGVAPPPRHPRAGRAGGATALLAWVIAVGGRGRPPSIVGGLACLGLLLTLAAGPGG